MIRRLALLALIGAAPIASNPSLGTAEGRCRPNEQGPAILISPLGLKDRTGTLRAELFPPDQADFLADAGKQGLERYWFHRCGLRVGGFAVTPVRVI